jgi:hypothetical protein
LKNIEESDPEDYNCIENNDVTTVTDEEDEKRKKRQLENLEGSLRNHPDTTRLKLGRK